MSGTSDNSNNEEDEEMPRPGGSNAPEESFLCRMNYPRPDFMNLAIESTTSASATPGSSSAEELTEYRTGSRITERDAGFTRFGAVEPLPDLLSGYYRETQTTDNLPPIMERPAEIDYSTEEISNQRQRRVHFSNMPDDLCAIANERRSSLSSSEETSTSATESGDRDSSTSKKRPRQASGSSQLNYQKDSPGRKLTKRRLSISGRSNPKSQPCSPDYNLPVSVAYDDSEDADQETDLVDDTDPRSLLLRTREEWLEDLKFRMDHEPFLVTADDGYKQIYGKDEVDVIQLFKDKLEHMCNKYNDKEYIKKEMTRMLRERHELLDGKVKPLVSKTMNLIEKIVSCFFRSRREDRVVQPLPLPRPCLRESRPYLGESSDSTPAGSPLPHRRNSRRSSKSPRKIVLKKRSQSPSPRKSTILFPRQMTTREVLDEEAREERSMLIGRDRALSATMSSIMEVREERSLGNVFGEPSHPRRNSLTRSQRDRLSPRKTSRKSESPKIKSQSKSPLKTSSFMSPDRMAYMQELDEEIENADLTNRSPVDTATTNILEMNLGRGIERGPEPNRMNLCKTGFRPNVETPLIDTVEDCWRSTGESGNTDDETLNNGDPLRYRQEMVPLGTASQLVLLLDHMMDYYQSRPGGTRFRAGSYPGPSGAGPSYAGPSTVVPGPKIPGPSGDVPSYIAESSSAAASSAEVNYSEPSSPEHCHYHEDVPGPSTGAIPKIRKSPRKMSSDEELGTDSS